MAWGNNFYTNFLSNAPLRDSPARIAQLDYLDPAFRGKVQAIISDAALSFGVRLMLFETYRSPARQKALYNAGVTQLPVIGVHGFGLAADLVKDVVGEPSWKGDFAFLGVLARKHKLIWGGDWGLPHANHPFVDACHVQAISCADQPYLFAHEFWPDAAYDPYTTA